MHTQTHTHTDKHTHTHTDKQLALSEGGSRGNIES